MDSNAKKTVQSTNHAEKSEAPSNLKSGDAKVIVFWICLNTYLALYDFKSLNKDPY